MPGSSYHLAERLKRVTHSIRFRLTLSFVAILALVLWVFGAAIYTLQARDLRRQTLERIEGKIQQIQSLEGFSRDEAFLGQLTIPNISQNAGPLLLEDEVLAVTDTRG